MCSVTLTGAKGVYFVGILTQHLMWWEKVDYNHNNSYSDSWQSAMLQNATFVILTRVRQMFAVYSSFATEVVILLLMINQ